MRIPVPRPDRPRAAATAALTLASAATLLVLMNYTAPVTTLAQTAAGLHVGAAAQVWLLSGISLGLAAALLPAGGLADNHGRKAVFVAGAAALAAASTACAAAPDAIVFVAGRILQGAASAALLAASLGVVGHSFPGGPARVRATGIWGAMLGAGIALGPIVSAALANVAGWRLWYAMAVLASVALAAAAARALPDSRAATRRRPDLPGALTLTAGVAALMAAVTLARAGWERPTVLLPAGAAAVLLAGFGWIESRSAAPLLDLALLRDRGFAVATMGALVTGLAVIGLMSYLSTLLEQVYGLAPVGAALLFGVWSGTSFVVAWQARRLARGASANRQLAIGLLLSAAGEAALAVLGADWGYLIPGLAVAGVGSGLANAALARLAVDSVPAGQASMGAGANNTARYIGASLGVAVVVSIANGGAAGAGHPAAHPVGGGVVQAILLSAGLAALAALVAARGPARDRTPAVVLAADAAPEPAAAIQEPRPQRAPAT